MAEEASARPQVSVGLKVWNSSWFSYLPGTYAGLSPQGVPGIADAVDAVEGSRKTTTLPVIGIRSGKFFVSGSHAQYDGDFFAPHSSVIGPNGQNVSRTDHLARKESDVTAGYSLTPNIAVTVGYKYATETRDTSLGISGGASRSLDARVKGLILGVVANFPIQGALSFYGLGGYGPSRVETTVPNVASAINSNGLCADGDRCVCQGRQPRPGIPLADRQDQRRRTGVARSARLSRHQGRHHVFIERRPVAGQRRGFYQAE
jgi:hypothetical protein